MATETESLSAPEQAYFDTRGADASIPAVVEADDDLAVDKGAELPDTGAETDVDLDLDLDTEGDRPTGQSKVPLAALTKTRNEAKEERNKRIAAETRAAVLEDRWNRVLETQQQPQQEAAPAVEEIPNPDTHPMEALAWATKHIAQAQAAEAAKTVEAQKTEREQQQWTQVYTAVNNDYTAAVAVDPTINEARDALIQSQGMEFMAMGLSQEEAQAEITRMENEHIRYAHAKGIPIGKYVTALAKARGWAPKAPTPAADPGADIDALADAVDGATSLSDTGGSAPRTLNAQSIADMKPEDFEKWLAKDGNQAKFKRLAGG